MMSYFQIQHKVNFSRFVKFDLFSAIDFAMYDLMHEREALIRLCKLPLKA